MFPDALIQPDLSFDFQVELNQSTGTSIIEVCNFASLLNTATPPEGYKWGGTGTGKAAAKLIYLQAQYLLPSIKGIDAPQIFPEDGDADRLAKLKEAEKSAPHKGLALYVDPAGGGTWKQRALIKLQNYGDTGMGRWSYFPLKTPYLCDDRGIFHPNSKIGAGIINTGSGTLGAADKIQIIGSAILVPNWVIDLSPASFANSASFGFSVGEYSPVQILDARSTRKQLIITSTGKIWFLFASNGDGCVANGCPFLNENGSLTYENGRLSFEGGRAELSALRGTQGLPLWAIADAGVTATVSGVEYW